MKVIGLTGGIGSGKSTVARIFEKLGIPVFVSDLEAREIVNSDPEVKAGIMSHFGEDLYVNDRLDRPKMASLVFGQPKELEVLNNLVHPAVGRAFSNWQKQQRAPYVLKEAAILIETGAVEELDALILVTAAEDIRMQRVQNRDGVQKDEVSQRIRRQMTDEEKRPYADFEILNDGQKPIIPQVLEVHQQLLSSI